MKILEVHSGLAALIAEKSKYDGVWVSSLTHSAAKGLPDNELVTLRERANFVREIRPLTTKPIIVDADTGGALEHVALMVKDFERAGAQAIVMEDKKFPKMNSLLENADHILEDVDLFCQKIRLAKLAADEIEIYARLESLIAKKSKHDALIRAGAYIEAGADGILIHSKAKVSAPEVLEIGWELSKRAPTKALLAVPTTYKLPPKHPFGIVIHANQMLRASLEAMKRYANGQVVPLADVEDVFELIGK